MRDAVICEPLRTPVGAFGGALRNLPAQDLATAVIRAAYEAGSSPERQRLRHVTTTPDAAIEENVDAASDGFHDLSEHRDRRRCAIEQSTTMVRDDDPVGAEVGTTHGVFRGHDPLDDQRAVPVVADTAQVIPRALRSSRQRLAG